MNELFQGPIFWLILAIVFNIGHTLFHIAFYLGYKGKNAVLYDGIIGYLGALFVIILCYSNRNTIEISTFITFPIGILFGGLGIALHIKAQLDFNKYGKNILKMHDENTILIEQGIYRYLKHPMYFGGALAIIGITFFFSSYLGFLMVWLWIILIAICGYLEELDLKKKLPDGKYDRYAKKTYF